MMDKKQTVFLSVIGVATLLTAVVGATFAYFSASATGDAQTVTVTTTNLAGLTFSGDVDLDTNTDVYPGWKAVQKLTVLPNGSAGAKGAFKLTLTPTVDAAFGSWIKYTVYRTTATAGDSIAVNPTSTDVINDNGKFSVNYTLDYTGDINTDASKKIVATSVLSGSTPIVIEAKREYTVGNVADEYYVVYEFINDPAVEQNAAMGKTFTASASVELLSLNGE